MICCNRSGETGDRLLEWIPWSNGVKESTIVDCVARSVISLGRYCVRLTKDCVDEVLVGAEAWLQGV